jgi:hypothetical protein
MPRKSHPNGPKWGGMGKFRTIHQLLTTFITSILSGSTQGNGHFGQIQRKDGIFNMHDAVMGAGQNMPSTSGRQQCTDVGATMGHFKV